MIRGTVLGLGLASVVAILPGCTEPGETTGIGAATGGVLGAGLGAIIGNQTGSTGGGLAIGALAGASAGAAVGNALEAQQEAIRTQDEAIERQEKTLQAQNQELAELRRSYGGDTPSFRTTSPGSRPAFPDNYQPPLKVTERNLSAAAEMTKPEPRFADDVARSGDEQAPSRGSYEWRDNQAVKPEVSLSPDAAEPATLNRDQMLSPECRNARDEIARSEKSGDTSEQLFRYRRALRLCPQHAEFHNGLGQLYLKLNRKADAEYEFREALRIDPGYVNAKENLGSLERY